MGIEINGLDANLKRLAKENQKAQRKALEKGSEYVRKELEKNSPVGRDSKQDHDRLKDHTTYSKINKDGEIKIGFDKEVAWRVHFTELGTIYQKPQAFIQQTQRETKEQFFDIVRDELRKELGL